MRKNEKDEEKKQAEDPARDNAVEEAPAESAVYYQYIGESQFPYPEIK